MYWSWEDIICCYRCEKNVVGDDYDIDSVMIVLMLCFLTKTNKKDATEYEDIVETVIETKSMLAQKSHE